MKESLASACVEDMERAWCAALVDNTFQRE
jgi:hypothetical protein